MLATDPKQGSVYFVIKGTGVDIIEIPRIERAAKASAGFITRVFTPGEIDACGGAEPKWASLAARFAAKEAAAKALGTGIGPVKWTDIEVINGQQGQPEIRLHGAAVDAAARAGIKHMSLSISHCQEYAVAFVVAC